MISRLIEWCARNRFMVFTVVLLVVLAGIWALRHTALDALPDISDVEVIVHTHWAGQPPGVIEDQVTYPLVTTFLSAPRVKAVRAQTMFGDSYVFIVFQDGTSLYWARARVLEYLQQVGGQLPPQVHPVLGPDATGAGWVYEYALVDKAHNLSLADLRSLQDWYLRYQLETVPGVAEVASIGGYVRQYQVRLDPNKLRAYGISLETVINRVRASSNEVGGDVLEMSGARYMIRGLGYIHSLQDLADVPVATVDGTPVLVKDLGTVGFGPDIRLGVADWNGAGQTVGGIVVMRYGGNALTVIRGVKAKLKSIAGSLPPGVQVVTAYDRSGLIDKSIATLDRDLIEELIIVSLVITVFLFHFRSALIPILTIPIAVVVSFLPMYYLHVGSNIMSLGGLALAIGVLVDAAIVMVENGYRHIAVAQHQRPPGSAERGAPPPASRPEHRSSAQAEPRSTSLDLAREGGAVIAQQPPEPGGRTLSAQQRFALLVESAKQVGPALFFSLTIIVLSFLPVFLLQAQEGRTFRPLAWTKTLAIAISSILAITLVPALMPLLIRGKLRVEENNPVSQFTQRIYRPILHWCLKHKIWTILINAAFLAAVAPLALHLGSEFMPPLFEGSTVYMPTALPGISITSATQLLQRQDRIIRGFPEVRSVFGTVGRSNSATDNAPLTMYDTTIMLKPRREWPAGMTYPKLIAAMDAKLQFPGLTNNWTMPVENRMDMELTGIKTPVGMKIQGPSLTGIQAVGLEIQKLLSGMPQVDSIFAERVAQGFYINIRVHRGAAARYGLTVADVQRAVQSGIGGEDIGTIIDGRERFPVNVRYNRSFRNDIPKLEQVVIATPTGAQIPLRDVASVYLSRGPTMIRDEGGQLTAYVYFELKTHNYGGFVAAANRVLRNRLALPAGYSFRWSGQYSFEQRAEKRLKTILPIVFFLIFFLLYIIFRSAAEAVILLIPTFFALTGGLLLQWAMHFEFSVAVWVGYIDLFGIAVETAVVMMIYLREAMANKRQGREAQGQSVSAQEVEDATMDGAVLRLRPVLMTAVVVLASLGPLLWETGIGSDVMKPIAAPIVGGMVTAAINVLILVPVFFAILSNWRARRSRHWAKAPALDPG
ncbi:MAG: efflux RND transporter permease subunit [Terriglobales bacterium]